MCLPIRWIDTDFMLKILLKFSMHFDQFILGVKKVSFNSYVL